MKYIWEEGDIWPGRYFGLPGNRGENNYDVSFLVTRTYKLGYCQQCRLHDDKLKYCQVAITDGAIYGHGDEKKMVETLNENGYVPLEGDELERRLMWRYRPKKHES